MSHITQILIAFLTGGGLLVLLNYLAKKRQDKTASVNDLMIAWKEESARLRSTNASLSDEIIKLNANVSELKSRLLMMEASHASLPIPQWIKDNSGVMLTLNTPYETAFLIPNGKTKMDYVGSKDHDIWPRSIADSYVSNDQIVRETKTHILTLETVDVQGIQTAWNVLKYPLMINNKVVGVAGIAFKEECDKKH